MMRLCDWCDVAADGTVRSPFFLSFFFFLFFLHLFLVCHCYCFFLLRCVFFCLFRLFVVFCFFDVCIYISFLCCFFVFFVVFVAVLFVFLFFIFTFIFFKRSRGHRSLRAPNKIIWQRDGQDLCYLCPCRGTQSRSQNTIKSAGELCS